jgi:hypothetical protein
MPLTSSGAVSLAPTAVFLGLDLFHGGLGMMASDTDNFDTRTLVPSSKYLLRILVGLLRV